MANPEYPDHIRPDQVFKVPITDGELRIAPAYDVLHHFDWLDQWILKYWDSEHEPPRFCDVIIQPESAMFLIDQLDLEVCSRTFITDSEMERVREYGASILDKIFGALFEEPDDMIE